MYERFKSLLDDSGKKTADVCKLTGIPPSTFSDWKKGKSSPKLEKLQKLANYFGVSVDYLTGVSEYKTKDEMFKSWSKNNDEELIADESEKIGKGMRIPVLGNVAAGIPIEAIENYYDVDDWEEIPLTMARTGRFFALKVKGDSMSPRICEGDVLIIRQQEDAESGDIVIAKVNGDDATCKRLLKTNEGISLISFNPVYEPMFFSNEDIKKKPVSIIGKVVENRQKF